MKTSKTYAFTLIELLVVISIIAILAGIALPVFSQVQVRGAQTKALSNSKQIGTALKLFALDNNGVFPSYQLTDGKPDQTKGVVSDSNTAFAQLVPDYMPSEDIFWLTKSQWCNATPPDNKIDKNSPDVPIETLKAGENEWAYVLKLNDTSNPSFPIIANGFDVALAHTYATSETLKGGVWKGKQAIVVRVDTSAQVMKVNSKTLTVVGPVGATNEDDIFSTGHVSDGWLGLTNVVVNPIAPAGN